MATNIDNLISKIRLLFRKDKEPYLRLYHILGFYPKDLSIYREALRHRSCIPRTKDRRHINNERLEFLGDAVLGLVVADILYEKYTDQQEGFLTTLRSRIVKRETLNELAVKIGLDKLVAHSNKMVYAHNNYMNGNAFEAFVGAIYMDRGYDYCVAFMQNRVFNKHIDIDTLSKKEENFKSKLIEWAQHYQCQFEFVITEEKMGRNNTPQFYSEVRIEGVTCGKGFGFTKKESHQQAAQTAYKKVCSNVKFVNSLMEQKKKRMESA